MVLSVNACVQSWCYFACFLHRGVFAVRNQDATVKESKDKR